MQVKNLIFFFNVFPSYKDVSSQKLMLLVLNFVFAKWFMPVFVAKYLCLQVIFSCMWNAWVLLCLYKHVFGNEKLALRYVHGLATFIWWSIYVSLLAIYVLECVNSRLRWNLGYLSEFIFVFMRVWEHILDVLFMWKLKKIMYAYPCLLP